MPVLRTVYEAATGRPVYEGFASDPSELNPGNSVIETEFPDAVESERPPLAGIDQVWALDGKRVHRGDYPQAGIDLDGLTATLGRGHIFGLVHAEVAEPDSYTFAPPGGEVCVTLDAALDEQGRVQLQPYTWDPDAEPPQTKGDLPFGWTLIEADVLRGVLPAGALSLAELKEEEG